MPSDLEQRPYKLYRSGPRGLRALLRGEEDAGLPGPGRSEKHQRRADGKGPGGGRITPRRVIKYLAIAIGVWLLLSLVLFIISAQIETGNLPVSASNALSPGGNMITS